MAVNDLEAVAGGLRLRNPRHEVLFDSAGLHLTPRGGGPSWAWRLVGVKIGQETLAGVELRSRSPQREEPLTVAYDRGALREEYLIGSGSIEQRFVLPQRVGTGDDLWIEGEVDSPGAFAATADGWVWSDGGGGVRLGDVRVFDARGRALPATMEVAAGRTAIRLDGRALATAAYPVVVDPEIGANDFRISYSDHEVYPPAVAYNVDNNEFVVVWSSYYSEYASAITGQRLNASTGAPVGPDFQIGVGRWDLAVAYSSSEHEFLVVWGSEGINGQRLNASTGAAVGPPLPVGDSGSFPDIAYNTARNEYLVVWEGGDAEESEIYSQRLEAATGAQVGRNDRRISDMSDASAPAVAYNSRNNQYLVVWHGNDRVAGLSPGENEIFGQRLRAKGKRKGANDFRISEMGGTGDASFDAFNPAVAYDRDDNDYLVVWDGEDNVGGLVDGEFEIFGQRLNARTGAEIASNDFRISDMGGTGDGSFGAGNPDVAYDPDDNDYLVVWWGDDNLGGLANDEYEIFGQRLDAASGAELGDNDFRISDMGGTGRPRFSAFEPAVTYNATNREYLVVWYGDDNVGGLANDEYEIFGQRLGF